MVAAILASRVLALVRDMVISYYFGASMVTDAYKTAFTLPDLFYYLIAGGALSSAFIPVFTEYLTKGDEENAWKVFSIFGTVFTLGLTVVIVAGEVFTEPLLAAMFPGFGGEKLRLTASLTRVIFPAQLFFFLGGLMMSTLYARGHFLMPALGPVVYNAAIILGGALGGALMGPVRGIYGLAWGVLGGALVGNVLMQVWTMRRVGVRYRPSLDVRHPGVVKAARLLLPVLLGLSLPQLCGILSRPFASDLGDGPITWMDNAFKVMQIPPGIFAQAISVAVFPTLSALAAQGDLDGLRRQFNLGLRSILFLTIPAAVAVVLLAEPLTALLFQRGKWTWEDTQATAAVTVFYSLAIFFVSGQQIVNRVFYAMQNTLTPMLVGTGATVVFLGLSLLFVGMPHSPVAGAPPVPYGEQVARASALALAYSLSMGIYMVVLTGLLRRTLGGLGTRRLVSSVGRVCLAAGAMGAVMWGCRAALAGPLAWSDPARMTTVGLATGLLACLGVGGLVYLAAVRLLRVPEAEFVLGAVTSRFGRLLRRRGGGAPRDS